MPVGLHKKVVEVLNQAKAHHAYEARLLRRTDPEGSREDVEFHENSLKALDVCLSEKRLNDAGLKALREKIAQVRALTGIQRATSGRLLEALETALRKGQ